MKDDKPYPEKQLMRMSDIPLRPLRATVDADWRIALIGLCVGREADVQTPQLAADNVRRRLTRMGGVRPVYLDELLAAAEHVVKAHRQGRGDILASINHLDNATRFARQVDMGAGSKANWGDLAEAEE